MLDIVEQKNETKKDMAKNDIVEAEFIFKVKLWK